AQIGPDGPKHPDNRQLYNKRGCPDAGARLHADYPKPKVATFCAALWLTFTLPLTSVRRQCALLTLARSNLYYEPKGESGENLRFMAMIDKQFLETPWYGSRQMGRYMKRNGHACGRHRVRRLMRLMRLVPTMLNDRTRPTES
uniref:IS3 family transposase n=1 Tax=Marivita sp. LZ-15-2 TaxID=2570353 RepID=UPI001BB1ECD9